MIELTQIEYNIAFQSQSVAYSQALLTTMSGCVFIQCGRGLATQSSHFASSKLKGISSLE